jgi:hypothetical protein
MSRSALALSLMMTGCALYVRPMSTLAPDDHVVLELNDQGIPDMAPRLGSGTFLVGGQLQAMDSTSLVMSVYRTQSTHALLDAPDEFRYPRYEQWGGETVTIPKFDIASARVQRVSGPFVALAALSAVAAGITIGEVVSHSHPKPPTL